MISSQTQSLKFLSPQHVIDQLDLAPGMRVADFGCGSGDFALAAARSVGRDGEVAAIDIQDSALSSVRSKARIEGIPNIQAIKANLEIGGASGLPDESQNAVLLTNILFQTENKAEILKESCRVLRPDGRLVFVDWKKDASFGPARGWRLDRDEVLRLIEKSGFAPREKIEAGAFHFGMIFSKT